jgi:hypothetical protein
MYINPFWFLACFLPQLSLDDFLRSSGLGSIPGSTDGFPILLASSLSFDPVDPFDDGLELPRRNVFRELG